MHPIFPTTIVTNSTFLCLNWLLADSITDFQGVFYTGLCRQHHQSIITFEHFPHGDFVLSLSRSSWLMLLVLLLLHLLHVHTHFPPTLPQVQAAGMVS